MNACLQPGNLISRSSERTLSIRLAALFSVVLFSAGCASFNRSGEPRPLSSASSLDTKSLASSGAGIAFSRAESAERDGKTDTAIRYYEQARTLDPNLAHLSRRLAVLYDQRGDDARARSAYEHALQLQPRDPDLLNDFGVYYLARENWPAAETWFRRSLAIDATHPRATNNLAMSLAMQNRLRESYEAFSRVVGPASAYSNLGVLLTTGPNRRSAGTLSTRAGIRSDGSSSRRVSQSTGPTFRGNAFFVIRLSSRACQLSGRV